MMNPSEIMETLTMIQQEHLDVRTITMGISLLDCIDPDIEKAYIPEYDMDKDGNIDFIDLDLLRKAIVGNNEYLTILVDPNEVAAEV